MAKIENDAKMAAHRQKLSTPYRAISKIIIIGSIAAIARNNAVAKGISGMKTSAWHQHEISTSKQRKYHGNMA